MKFSAFSDKPFLSYEEKTFCVYRWVGFSFPELCFAFLGSGKHLGMRGEQEGFVLDEGKGGDRRTNSYWQRLPLDLPSSPPRPPSRPPPSSHTTLLPFISQKTRRAFARAAGAGQGGTISYWQRLPLHLPSPLPRPPLPPPSPALS